MRAHDRAIVVATLIAATAMGLILTLAHRISELEGYTRVLEAVAFDKGGQCRRP